MATGDRQRWPNETKRIMENHFELKQYSQDNFSDVIAAIGEDPNWEFIISSESKRENYYERLQNSATYVCYSHGKFCGYIRAIVDKGMALYISELFVKPEFRNQEIGYQLIKKVKESNTSLTVYALSDEDRYYEKKDYKKIGSVFEI